MTEELWEMLGENFSIHQQSFPKVDENYLLTDSVTIVIQVNGKVRENLVVDRNTSEEEIKSLAQKSSKVQKFVGDNPIKKSIYIPGKILNLVV